MALRNQSLFLYGFQVTSNNSSIDFRIAPAGTILQATLSSGSYSLATLLDEIVKQMQAADPAHLYTATADREVSGGTQNRVTIATSNGTTLELLFSSGPRVASSAASLIGFNATDYTGFLTYTGSSTAGTALVPNFVGYNYLSPDFYQKLFGSVNVSASGLKESIVYQLQMFWQVQFKYIPQTTWSNEWTALMQWLIQQRDIDFTPDITDANTFFTGSVETTNLDGKGLGFKGTEMLLDFPFLYDTGLLLFRQKSESQLFI